MATSIRTTGSTILHYRLQELLGSGGMGEVYRAEDLRLGRPVALKFLHPSFQQDPECRARLLTEARAASALRSANIAAIYDIAEHDGSLFIVMEYVDGELVARRIARGPLPVTDALSIAMQVADALDEAHERGMVHRDIKSANLMLTARGVVKVLDFGLATFIEGRFSRGGDAGPTMQVTAAGTILGTVAYMSPEQALGRPLDRRSDIFSLGVVLYEVLAARLPFAGQNVTEVIDRILHDDPPALARFNYEVSPELEGIVRKALRKDPAFRYQTARELHIDLANLQREVAATARAASTLGPGGATVVVPGREARGGTEPAGRAPNAVAVMSFTNITQEPADDWIGSGIAETVTADLQKVHGLSVIGRARIFDVVKNLGIDRSVDDRIAIDVGRRLGARWIIVGGYQRMADLVRITAQFLDVETGTVVKTVKIDGQIGEIFDLQDKIVYELSQGLNMRLRRSEIAEIARQETRSVQAYEYFSRGMMNLRMASRESLDRAIHLFERATEHDPAYARAWAALGAAYELKGSFLSLPELVQRAVGYLRRALELNAELVDAHAWLGSALLGGGRYDEAIASLETALRLDPNNPRAHGNLARAYWIGKGMIDEGIAELERVITINPQAGYSYLQLGLLYAMRGDYARAEQVCREAIELQEQYMSGNEGLLIVGAHTRLGYVYYRQGRYDEAIREYEKELTYLSSTDHLLRERTTIEIRQKLGAAYLRKGQSDEAERHFALAARAYEDRRARGADDPFTKYYIACLYALRGDADRAFKYLAESSRELPALNAVRARTDPDLESLHPDPRFRTIAGE